MIRQPIIAVLGHVDHGKTSLLDKIRGTRIQNKEAGGITQDIGATEIPLSTINTICKGFLKTDLKIPGLLFIDTPGHEAFTSLRQRGGSIADLAILVIDINQGVQPQTIESIKILKTFKTPFIVVLNKIDLVNGWKAQEDYCYSKSFNKQSQMVKDNLMQKIYKIMGELSLQGFDSDMFNNIDDYSKKIALLPVSSKSGEGILELLLTLSGLAQKYLENNLKLNIKGEGKASILEVKEVEGLGTVIDVILYDGSASVGDDLIFQEENRVMKTKIKALLKPKPLTEMRKTKEFESLKKINAAIGVRISAPHLENALSGTPIIIKAVNEEKTIKELEQKLKKALFQTQQKGVFVKADSLGSLEAVVKLFKKEGISIQKTGIGEINKKDAVYLMNIKKINPRNAIILTFNVKVNAEAKKILTEEKIIYKAEKIIYKLSEEYFMFLKKLEDDKKREIIEKSTTPCLIQVKKNCMFRASSPCIVGVDVLKGDLNNNVNLLNLEGQIVGKLKGMQISGKPVLKAEEGEEVAISIDGARVGKNIEEEDFLIVDIKPEDYYKLRQNLLFLTSNEKQALNQTLEIKRKQNPLYGI